MASVIQTLRDEHAQLLPHLEHVLALADAIEPGSNAALIERVGAVHGFLTSHLLDHAYVEEQALYPTVGRTLGAPEATATMSRDHVEIGRLIDELSELRREIEGGAITPAQAQSLRRVLYGLYAIVKLHFAKEEEVYLKLLEERLSPSQARDLQEALELAGNAA
ncbi:MAG TPA: hemerythrin domain-containing protein [bacterium]|nr:hemerythrin domain-containing protein [bacterium]